VKYVLVTPARNEEAFIGKTLESVTRQTILPERWVVVDDGSTDRTAEIVEEYGRRYPWIDLLRRPRRAERTFAGKARAFQAGFEQLQDLQFEIVGNLDADISFEPDYFAFLLGKFAHYPRLGVTGTAMREPGYQALKDSFFNEQDVFGACQLFRVDCFKEVGGYTPIKWGGIDWVAVRTARLKGWQTRSFPEKVFIHYRPMGSAAGGTWRARFDYGRKDYFLGNHPLWEVFRVTYQLTRRPYLIGGLILLGGYLYALGSNMQRPIEPELLRFHRTEQLARLRDLFAGVLRTGRLRLRS
jgi:biofilm PGA synthesis N-glycosyltransferase PgaC